ncbi:MAG: YbjN domain-containing protein [Pseudomonadota bacterium]
MIDLVGAMGYEVSRVDRVPGSLRVVSDRGRKFLLSLRICEGADFTLCEALQLTAYRSNVPKASFEMVNELNARQLMSQIYYDANQKVMVSKRFITIKDGVAPANIEANILAFVEMDELLTPMINEIAERQN